MILSLLSALRFWASCQLSIKRDNLYYTSHSNCHPILEHNFASQLGPKPLKAMTSCLQSPYFQMNTTQYKNFLVKIKEQFDSRITASKSTSLSVEEVSQLLYRHENEEPIVLRDFLLRGTGKTRITWDDLLQYLQQEISIRSEVKRIEHSPTSATEIIESHQNQFGRLINYVKQKETNIIQSIRLISKDIADKNIFLTCMDKEIVLFDYDTKEVIKTFTFKYAKLKQKMIERDEMKRTQKQRKKQEQILEYLDTVNIESFEAANDNVKKLSLGPPNLREFTNIRSSMRGSVLSNNSRHTEKGSLMRKTTESAEARRKSFKANYIRVKNDDVGKVFQLFQNATVQNSMVIARAFTEARDTFQKNIVLERGVLQKEKSEKNYGLLQVTTTKDYRSNVNQMRSHSLDLSKIKKSLQSQNFSMGTPLRRGSMNSPFRQNKQKKAKKEDPLQNTKQDLQIVNISLLKNYLLVSLFNREVRLLSLKQGPLTIKEQVIFEKQFKSIATYVQLYKSLNNGSYRMAVILDKHAVKGHSQNGMAKSIMAEDSGLTELIVYHLDQNMMIKNKYLEYDLQFSAKYQSALPFGGVLFNQKGNFGLLQLNNSSNGKQQRVSIETVLYNPVTSYRISIKEVRVHKNMTSFFLCCSAGFVYLFDRLAKQIKYHIKLNSSPVLDIRLIKDDSELLALHRNGNMVILSSLHLEKVYLYQSYHDVSYHSKLLEVTPKKFSIYHSRGIDSYCLCQNEQRQFNNAKPVKVLKNRMKLRKKSIELTHKQKQKVHRIIQGKGGKGDFICILTQGGQVCFLDPELNYIGSYYCLNITSIVEITCNETYQFIGLLYDDNSLEIVNLYTQHLLFTINNLENQNRHSQTRSRSRRSRNASKSSFVLERQKTSKPSKYGQSIAVVNFFSPDLSDVFLSVITQNNYVYHYSQKGVRIASVNLEESCGGVVKQTQMLYQGESLVLMTAGALTILYRQSYHKKCVIGISSTPLAKIRRTHSQGWSGLVCLDKKCNVFLVDIHLKQVKNILSISQSIKDESIFFNQHLIFRISEEGSKVLTIKEKNQKLIRVNVNLNFYTTIGKYVVQIGKQSGKVSIFSFKSRMFQQCSI